MQDGVQEVSDRFHSAAIHILRRAREADAATGIGPARLSALSVVVFRGPLTLGELATADGVRSATMTGIVNGLEREGLVTRRRHDRDGRAVQVEATSAGRALLAEARAQRIDRIAERLGGLTHDEVELLRRAAALLESRFSLRPWQPVEHR